MTKRTSVARLLLLVLPLFGGLIYFTNVPHQRVEFDHVHMGQWMELQVDLKGAYADLPYDFVVVQDTLGFYFAELAAGYPAGRHEWELEGCCGDGNAAAGLGPMAAMYKGQFTFRFAEAEALEAFWGKLVRMEEVDVQQSRNLGLAEARLGSEGVVDLSLLIPGRNGAQLHLQGVRFRMQRGFMGTLS